jgi:pSer/pThr/pTyr-binding forkhead associated (FHA) protein
MKWALKVDRGKRKGMIIPIQKSPFLIGRNNECQLRADNPYVSHHHCELRFNGEKVIVRDCLSTNGTFINSQKIEGEVELHEGDELKIGSLAFVVCREERKPVEDRCGPVQLHIRLTDNRRKCWVGPNFGSPGWNP